MAFYRFKCGKFIEAETFDEAQLKFVKQILNEEQDFSRWHKCTCLGLSHRHGCPEHPVNQGEVPY